MYEQKLVPFTAYRPDEQRRAGDPIAVFPVKPRRHERSPLVEVGEKID
jgi:hypothetical protein